MTNDVMIDTNMKIYIHYIQQDMHVYTTTVYLFIIQQHHSFHTRIDTDELRRDAHAHQHHSRPSHSRTHPHHCTVQLQVYILTE